MKKAVITLIIIMVAIEIAFAYYMNQLSNISGESILDMQILNQDEIYEIVSNYGDEGRAVYGRIGRLDMLFPVVYGIFLALLIGIDSKKLMSLPIVAAIMDLSENLMVQKILGQYPNRLDIAVYLKYFTLMKFVLITCSVIIIIGFRWRRRI